MGVEGGAQLNNIISQDACAGIAHLSLDALCFTSNLCLVSQWLELATNLSCQVSQTREVSLHRFKFAHGLFLAATVLENSRSFFNETASIFWAGLKNVIESTLTHNDVHLATQTGVGEKLLHIQQTAVFTVDGVFTGPITEQGSANGDFRVFDGQCTI